MGRGARHNAVMSVSGSPGGDWAQGSLRLIPPSDLLDILARRRFSGRLVLMTAAAPRRVIAVHFERGRPMVVVGTGLPHGDTARHESFRARQLLLEALGWSAGSFRVEGGDGTLPKDAQRQELGEVANLLLAARERARVWPKLLARLPAPATELWVAPRSSRVSPTTPAQGAVLEAITERMPLAEIASRTHLDEHVAVLAVLDLADSRAVALATESGLDATVDPAIRDRIASLLELVGHGSGRNHTLKITVLSWDSRTCFRTVNALLGRDREPPEDVERQPRYQVLHETLSVAEPYALEILAFRSDAFEPAFAAPLVHDSHIFLVVTDVDAGHVWGGERTLVERLNEIREMFRGSSVAGRITIGAGAMTDPGCDVLLAELGRYVSWSDVHPKQFLASILTTLCDRLGVTVTPPA